MSYDELEADKSLDQEEIQRQKIEVKEREDTLQGKIPFSHISQIMGIGVVSARNTKSDAMKKIKPLYEACIKKSK
jgi:hypothetical protein